MTRNQKRIIVTIVAASLALFVRYAEYLRTTGGHSDFGAVWFGARSLLHGVNPYPLVGPGRPFEWDFHLNYPATAMVAVLPFGLLPELAATLIFVWVSAALLTWGLFEKGLERLWILPSASFIVAARAGQWSPLYSAVFLLPWLGWMISAKPTLGAAVFGGAFSTRLAKYAVVGTLALLAVSFFLLPNWIREWTHVVQPNEFKPAVLWPGGFVLILAVLRWRRPEARLLLAMSLIPMTSSWYEALPLLLIGRTKRECQILSLVSSTGYLCQGFFSPGYEFVEVKYTKALMLVFCYLPALIVVLRRPREDVSGEVRELPA